MNEKRAAPGGPPDGVCASILVSGRGGGHPPGFLGSLGKSAERLWIVDRDVGQHLAVQLDAALAQAGHELAVGDALAPCRSVDADDPERAEVALAGPPV